MVPENHYSSVCADQINRKVSDYQEISDEYSTYVYEGGKLLIYKHMFFRFKEKREKMQIQGEILLVYMLTLIITVTSVFTGEVTAKVVSLDGDGTTSDIFSRTNENIVLVSTLNADSYHQNGIRTEEWRKRIY